jgi:hypothetical protein
LRLRRTRAQRSNQSDRCLPPHNEISCVCF